MPQFPSNQPTSQLYAVQVEFPHGPVIIGHRNIRATNDAERLFVLNHIKRTVAANPDATFDARNVWMVEDPREIQGMVEQLQRNTGKPLATELGLDHPNRLIADPAISRALAGQAAANVPG